MSLYSAVCFDVDGTLYPVSEMKKRMAKIYACHPLFALRYKRMRKAIRLIQSSFCDSEDASYRQREAWVMNCTPEQLDRFIYSPMKKAYSTLTPFNGVRTTLERLKDKGIKIGVLSDFPLFGKLQAMGISDLVDVALSSDDTGFLKPDVHGFEKLLYKLDVRSCDALFVGDNAKTDIEGAKMAGMDVCQLSSWSGFDSFLMERGL